MTISQGLGGP